VERRGPSLAVEAYFNAPADSATANRATALAEELVAIHHSLSHRFGRARGVTLISVVLLRGMSVARGGGTTLFLPAVASEPQENSFSEQYELARRVASAWWPFKYVLRQDAWLAAGVQTSAALEISRELLNAEGYAALCQHLQQVARSRQEALFSGSPPQEAFAAAALPQRQTENQPQPDTEQWLAAKSGMVLNALRLEMGDSHFFNLLHDFARVIAGKPDLATTVGFEKLTDSFGNYDWFWQQWLLRPELPQVQFRWLRTRLPRSGQTVSVEVRQAGQPFGFRAPIRVVAGTRTYWQSIEVHNADTILGIPVRGRVAAVEFDPEHQLLTAGDVGATQ
jgi:hypothetical protein